MLIRKSAIYGLLLGIGLVVGTQILTWLGLGLTSWFMVLTFGLVIVFLTLGLRRLKQQSGGRLTMAKAALAVVVVILVSRFIFQLYMFAYINYFDPDWVNRVARTWSASMQEAELPADQIARRIESFRQAWKTLPMFTIEIVFVAIPQFVLGFLISLFFVLGKQPEPVE